MIIKEYEITTAGSASGLTLPSGFRVGVCSAEIVPNHEDSTWSLVLEVCTWTDGTYAQKVQNDDVSNKFYNLGASVPNNAIQTMINNYFKPDLDTAYGSENVTVL